MKSLWMLGAGLCYALLAACVKLSAEQGVPMGQIVFFRSLLSLIALYSFMRWRGFAFATPQWKAQLSGSLPGLGSLVTYFLSIKLLPLATAVSLNYTTPVFLGMLLMLSKHQPARPLPIMALVAGFVGVILLLQPSFNPSEWLGCLLATASGLLAAFYLLNIRRLGELGEPSIRTVFYYALSCTVMLLPWFLFSTMTTTMATSMATTATSTYAWAMLLAIGVLGTMAQVMMTKAFQQGKPLLSASLGYSQVIFSIVLGMWIWHNGLPAHVWLGILLIIMSGIVTSATTQK